MRILHCLRSKGELTEGGFGVPVEHACVGFVEERIFDAGEPFAFATLEDNDGRSAVDFEDGHAVDGAVGIVARVGVDHVVSANDNHDAGGAEFSINLLQF